MYNLLIVDDEPIIVEGLYELFTDLKELELEVFKADSGAKALEVIKKVKIDVVLLDICMPDMDGIQVQAAIKAQWPSAKVIFLTGYDDFDYIQSALRNGSIDYILKIEGDEAIIEAVKKAINLVKEDNKNTEFIERARENMQKALPLLREKYLEDLLEGLYYVDEKSPKEFESLQLTLNCREPVMLLMARLDGWRSIAGKTDITKILYTIEAIGERYLSKACKLYSIVYERSMLLWFLQPSIRRDSENPNPAGESWDTVKPFIHGIMESIQENCKEAINAAVSLVVSEIVTDWRELSQAYYSLLHMMDKIAGVEEEALLIYSSKNDSNKNDSNKNDNKALIRHKLNKITVLVNYLEGGQEEDFFDVLKNIFTDIKDTLFMPKELESELFYGTATAFLSYINKLDLYDTIDKIMDLSRFFDFCSYGSWQQVYEYFVSLGKIIFDCRKKNCVNHNEKIIKFINEYIEENLDGDISVTKLAEILYFNPSYLSRIYKQYTGNSISDHIAEVKFQKAQRLLRQSNMKIHDISLNLGFENPSYFTRFFKKRASITPQEFRDFAAS